MWLTLDIGNSAVKAALFDGDRLADDATWLSDGHIEDGLTRWIDHRPVARAGLCSVVPTVAARVIALLDAESTLVVTSKHHLPFDITYSQPERLGSDRIAAAACAWTLYGNDAPVVVIDAGTTVTIDVVTASGYKGGAIAPGPALLMESLTAGTASLPRAPLKMPLDEFGQSTISALQHGIMHGFIDLVAGAVERASQLLPDRPVIVATGGWHRLLAEYVDAIDHVHPHLVLRGIREIMRLNPLSD